MSRRSRYEIRNEESIRCYWKAGAYIRLSREDGGMRESNSISVENQKKLIDSFLSKAKGIELVDYFIDDGYTGTDLDRPGFKRLQAMYENGKINCIIVKDLSRLARNSEESGKLINIIFPFFKIRFVSINDNIDSFERPESIKSIEVSFKNIMHDEFARENSIKVRAAQRERKSKGLFLGAFAAYGYKKDENNHHKIIIDEEVAGVVQFIFEEYLKEQCFWRVAKALTVNKIKTPYQYKLAKGKKYKNPNGQPRSAWSTSTIKGILLNEVYIGNMVQCKRKVLSYKNQKIKEADAAYWIRVENTHEAIIHKELFYKVQEIIVKRGKERVSQRKKRFPKNVWSGFVFCGYCGRSMSAKRANKDYMAIYCKGQYDGTNCEIGNQINRKIFEKVVVEILNTYIKLSASLEKKIKQTNERIRNSNKRKSKQAFLEKEYELLAFRKSTLYASLKEDRISKEFYLYERQCIEKKMADIVKEIKNECAIEEQNQGYNILENNFIKVYHGHKKIVKITREVLEIFVEKIIVYSKEKMEIKLRFMDDFKEACDWVDINDKKI